MGMAFHSHTCTNDGGICIHMGQSHNFGPSGTVSLADTLHHLTKLDTVDLSHNNISLHSAIAVITVLMIVHVC